MNKNEFLQTVEKSGYARKGVAEEYVKRENKEEYKDSDLIEVFRIDQEQRRTVPLIGYGKNYTYADKFDESNNRYNTDFLL